MYNAVITNVDKAIEILPCISQKPLPATALPIAIGIQRAPPKGGNLAAPPKPSPGGRALRKKSPLQGEI